MVTESEMTGMKGPSPDSSPVVNQTGGAPLEGGSQDGRQKAEDGSAKAAKKAAHKGATSNVQRATSSSEGGSMKALLYRGLEIIRNMTGHAKSAEYLELEEELGLGPKEPKAAAKAAAKPVNRPAPVGQSGTSRSGATAQDDAGKAQSPREGDLPKAKAVKQAVAKQAVTKQAVTKQTVSNKRTAGRSGKMASKVTFRA